MSVEIKVLRRTDAEVLRNIASGVFDHPIDSDLATEFLADSRHHLVVAIDEGVAVGFVSSVHYIHPDKGPELWINEVAVAPRYQGKGVGKALMRATLKEGRKLGCLKAWVLTYRSNSAAMRLYAAAGGIPDDQVLFAFSLGDA